MHQHLRTAIGQVLYRSNTLAIGVFNCPRQHPCFGDSGPIGNDIMVFPRHAVYIRHSGRREVLANHQVITLYNKGQTYRRTALAEYGDYSVWLHFPRAVLVSAMQAAGLGHRNMDNQPFASTHQLISSRAFIQERWLHRYLLNCASSEPLLIEETALQLLDQLLSITDPPAHNRQLRQATARRHRDLVIQCQALLTRHWNQRLLLSDLATRVGSTPFHLARIFKARTGQSIHQYQRQLRLRRALDGLLDRPQQRLTDLALDCGFATPSHFTDAFRSSFGMPPGQFVSHRGTAAGRPASARNASSLTEGRVKAAIRN